MMFIEGPSRYINKQGNTTIHLSFCPVLPGAHDAPGVTLLIFSFVSSSFIVYSQNAIAKQWLLMNRERAQEDFLSAQTGRNGVSLEMSAIGSQYVLEIRLNRQKRRYNVT